MNFKTTQCHGINCFPSNRTCQRIEQSWIQEIDQSYDNTSDQFILTYDINFCSCYSPQNILNQCQNNTPIAVAHSDARFITYNPYDDTLIVLGDTFIAQYFASNLTRFRNISVTVVPLSMVIDSKNIYITFSSNFSVNLYDMNLRFNQTIRISSSSSSSRFYGLALWKNGLLVTDDQMNLIRFINLTTMNISIYLDLTSYNIEPFNIAINNNYLYISQRSSTVIYVYDLVSFSMNSLRFSSSTSLYRLANDPYCNRLWFGTQTATYTSVPIVHLGMRTIDVYQAKGVLATAKVYKIEFDANYSMYTVSLNENYFYKYQMSSIFCDKN
ncbi:hypothetical protein I4U23_020327 [Adineta vaga]|nr:hypothetical protein I4U23_020327 [Adineta vaga]